MNYFNPRSRVGNDDEARMEIRNLIDISIHVPAWGTTKDEKGGIWFDDISIHVPAWGTTVVCSNLCITA